MDDTTQKILEIVTDIQDRVESMEENMATKADVLANTIAIEKLSDKVDNLAKNAKEDIDMLVSRVTVVEKRVDALA